MLVQRRVQHRHIRVIAGAAGVAVVAALVGVGGPVRAAAAPAWPLIDVIIRYDDPDAAERAVRLAGGVPGQHLGLIGGLAARLPRSAVPAVDDAAGVLAVTPDASVTMKAAGWGDDDDDDDDDGYGGWYGNPYGAGYGSSWEPGDADDAAVGSMRGVTRSVGADAAWVRRDGYGRRITGSGVGVALIDSGIAPVRGLATAGKVVNGPDLSFESQAPNLRYLDTYGHGTHLAGIIAGRDPGLADGDLAGTRDFVGVAPGAHVVNVKVASADGATDVSQVIAAIDWVVRHRDDPGMNIRVLNLAFGTDSTQDSRLDPLSFAVEMAWRKGIVVVVSVGNDGAAQTRLAMPAVNPYVIAVGAADPMGTATRADDTVADFSTRGAASRHADLVAPGRSVVSLRSPGSYADANHPQALLDQATDPTGRYFRGSGTSQSAAVVSGAAALLLQQRPSLTPDQVKRLLITTADDMPAADPIAAGAGQLDVAGALSAPTPSYRQSHPFAIGLGSLEASRGSAHVADSETGVELTGEQDIFGARWNPAGWALKATLETSWTGGYYNGNLWTGSAWDGSSWTARTWSARTWSARTWSGVSWSARTWSEAVWTGVGWSARTWAARTWAARTWAGRTWSTETWS